MRFVLNQELIELDDSQIDINLSLLRYLREFKHLCGTKEGCASGDCGACTVLLGHYQDDAIRSDKLTSTAQTTPPEENDNQANKAIHYHSVNACILPLSAIHCRHVVTVEHLTQISATVPNTSAGEHLASLYPSQQAMVEHHASQCGFCTPGFVMSLTGLLERRTQIKADTTTLKESVKDCIAGNLCRCTGYRPIVEAGVHMFDLAMINPPADLANNRIVDTMKMLNTYGDSSKRTHQYWQPVSLNEVCNILHAQPEARIIAGGTDLMLEVTQHFKTLTKIIDISRVAELKQITRPAVENAQARESKIRIGAAVTYTELLHAFSDIQTLQQLILRIGAEQVRNRGTVGGNIANASPIADLPPVFLALDANIEIIDGQQKKSTVNIDAFYSGYKHTVLNDTPACIIAIEFNADYLNDFLRFYKLSKRIEDDISSVMTAVRFAIENNTVKDVRIAFGGMAATPIRARQSEQCFIGKSIDDEQTLQTACNALRKELSPMSDVRASAEYRLNMAENLLRKAWLELNGHHLPTINQTHFTQSSQLRTGEEQSHA
ncbi:Carbon monoxide dehydrogenase medium chain [Thalassocella blandensis]|nr:Carbon monoxide dehydrogenase medium chain [Thalassocella blandensis]